MSGDTDAGAPAGDLSKEAASVVRPAANTLPMPPNPGKQEVSVATRIEVTPDLKDKNTPKDAALAFALLHVLWRDGLIDLDFMAAHTVGWEELEPLLVDCTPAWGEATRPS